MEMFNHILKPSKVRYLNTAFLAYLSEVGLSHLAVTGHLLRNDKVKHCHTKISTTVLLVALLATCKASPSYAEVGKSHFGGNSDFVEQLNKISYLLSISEESSQLAKINQLPVFDSFNCIDKVAVTGNNARQERQNLFKSVQHHTLVDVFLCLSFASCLFTGELRLAALWWGGHGNKPFIRQIQCAVDLTVLNLPTALHLGQITKTSLPVRKV